jgi:hypothetical protein
LGVSSPATPPSGVGLIDLVWDYAASAACDDGSTFDPLLLADQIHAVRIAATSLCCMQLSTAPAPATKTGGSDDLHDRDRRYLAEDA